MNKVSIFRWDSDLEIMMAAVLIARGFYECFHEGGKQLNSQQKGR